MSARVEDRAIGKLATMNCPITPPSLLPRLYYTAFSRILPHRIRVHHCKSAETHNQYNGFVVESALA